MNDLELLQHNIYHFTRRAHILRSLSVSFGTLDEAHTLRDGYARDGVPVDFAALMVAPGER